MTETNTEWPLLLCCRAVTGHDYTRPGATSTTFTESRGIQPQEPQVLHAIREHIIDSDIYPYAAAR